jgi:Flp pilus assembly protein TadG
MMKRRLIMLRSSSGQTLLEFALMTPLMISLALGVVEVSYALLDQNTVTRLTREGSNLISRDASLQTAATALSSMSSRPVDFSNGNSKVIFSVILRVATTGAANFGKDVLYQRYEYGSLSASSALTLNGSGAFGPAPDYIAINSDTNTGLQVTNLAPNLVTSGGLLYVTEIYTKHPLITPLDRFGISLPTTLYSIAYF